MQLLEYTAVVKFVILNYSCTQCVRICSEVNVKQKHLEGCLQTIIWNGLQV